MTAALGIALLICSCALTLYHLHVRRIMNRLDKMLDKAVGGGFEADSYDESQISKIEFKFSRFINACKLKKGQIEHDQEKVHSLISDISHQTKTPIANILLYAQLLIEQQDLSEEAKTLSMQTVTGAEKLNFLIQSLVKASRLESGIIKIMSQKSDINELLEAALGECTLKAQEKGVELTFKPIPQPQSAMCDPRWCTEALYNILDNAIKYTGRGGRVDVFVKSYEMFIRIDITDTGMGISEEDLPRVFGRFWRAKESLNSEGVGIGLYLAREIIAACGGYIKVSSTKYMGSVFSVFLPKS